MQGLNTEALARIGNLPHSSFDPLSCITPGGLVCQIEAFRCGVIAPFIRTADAIQERDDMTSSVTSKASAAVSRHGHEVVARECAEELREMAEEQREQVDQFFCNVTATEATDLDYEEGFEGLVRGMMDARGVGYAVHHIVWQPDGAGGLTATFIKVPGWFFSVQSGRLHFHEEGAPGDYAGASFLAGAIPDEGGVPLYQDEQLSWLKTVHTRPLMIPTAVAYYYKKLPLRDWLIFAERYGFPYIDVSTTADYKSEEWAVAEQFLRDIVGGCAGLRSSEITFNVHSLSPGGENPYKELVDRMDRNISVIHRGSDLGTMSRGAERTSGASLQGDETEQLDNDNARWIAATLNRQIVPHIVSHYHGPDAPVLVDIKLRTRPVEDVDSDLKVMTFLRDSGFPVGMTFSAGRLGIPEARDDEATLTSPNLVSSPAPEPAITANESPDRPPTSAEDPLLRNAIAEAAGVSPRWLAPLGDELDQLEAILTDPAVPDEQAANYVQNLLARFPDIFRRLDFAALESSLERGMGTAAARGLSAALSGAPESADPADLPS